SDRRHSEMGIAKEVDLRAGQRADSEIEQTKVGVDHERPDQGDDQRGLQRRKIDKDSEEGGAASRGLKRQRYDHAEHEDSRYREHAVVERVADAFENEAVGESAAPIVEARELRRRQDPIMLKAKVEQPNDRERQEDSEKDEDRRKEQVGGQVVACGR